MVFADPFSTSIATGNLACSHLTAEVDPMGGTTASGFVIGRETVSDLSQNQATKACRCCDCGHVGQAAALSTRSAMSTALSSRRPLVPARHTAMGACPPNA